MGTTLFIIDPQNDFMDTPEAPLGVPGAIADMNNLIDLLIYHGDKINRIVVPLDQHPPNHIAHARMWIDRKGDHPKPFTRISNKDVNAGLWRASVPTLEVAQAEYVESVELAGEELTIWPEHCLIGSHGACIFEPLWDTLRSWWQPGRDLLLFPKSGNWQTEQYSSFKAAVVMPDDPATDFNYGLRDAIIDDQTLVSGEALSHCVAASVEDAINWTHTVNLVERMVLLEDATSPVRGFEQRGQDFVAEFVRLGGRLSTTGAIFGDPPEC
jgi:nicotinamidase/pyrazinamidase